MRISKTSSVTVVLTALVVAGSMTMSAAPASASINDGYISGAGSIYDDWGDEGTISTSSYAASNATCLWQTVLWAEGLLLGSSIDGIFGPVTEAATEKFQERYSDLEVDGKAGPKTFGKADNKLRDESIYPGAGRDATYKGAKAEIEIVRTAEGRHKWVAGGELLTAGYNFRDCS